MRRNNVSVYVAPGFWILIAISICLLPLSWIVGWLFALFIHELGHCLAIKVCGARLQQIKLTLFGAEIVSDIQTAWKEIICILAGPICGLTLISWHRILPVASLCAFVHSAYNFLPLVDLDGGQALSCILRLICKGINTELACRYIDRVTRVVLFMAAIYMSWRMQWWVLSVFAGILLFHKNRKLKYTCKRKRLQVQ